MLTITVNKNLNSDNNTWSSSIQQSMGCNSIDSTNSGQFNMESIFSTSKHNSS
jgi:hypothetical protein